MKPTTTTEAAAAILEARISKLPAWVQDHIRTLERHAEHLEGQYEELKATVEAGPEDSDVFAEIDGTTRPLGKGGDVSFRVASGDYTVHLQEDGGLGVDATHDLVIEPTDAPYQVVLRMKGA